jgi:tetratricopeptide (TPR) repeat protein
MRTPVGLLVGRPAGLAPVAVALAVALTVALAVALAVGLAPAPARAQAQAPVLARPHSLQDAMHQAELLLRQGQTGPATELLERLRAEAPDDARLVVLLGRAYERGGASDRAIALYEEALAGFARDDLGLWIELSRARQLAGQGAEAVEALLRCTRAHPAWGPDLVDRFELLVSDSTAGPAALRALEQAAGADDVPLAWLEILGNVYATTGQSERSLELLMRLERRQPGDGRLVLNLAKTLARSDRPQLALAAYDSLFTLPAPPDALEEGWFEKAGVLADLGRTPEAIEAYRTIEERFPRGTLAPRAALTRANLTLTTGDLAAARVIFAELLERADAQPRRADLGQVRDETRLGLAECALRQGDFAAAREVYADLAQAATRAELRERAAFEQAELLFYEGRLPEAEAGYYALTDAFRQGDCVNDALARILLLGEHSSAGDALKAYAAIAYRERIGEPDSALTLCRATLAAYPDLPLRAELRAVETRLLGRAQRWAEADSALAQLLAQDPRQRAAARALLTLAEAGWPVPDRREVSRAYLERLVLEYPDAPEARRARGLLAQQRRADEHS